MRAPGTPKFRSPWQCDWHRHRWQVPFQPLTPLSSTHSCQLWCLCRSCIWGEVFLLHKISHFPNVFSITCAYTHLHTRSHMHTHAGTRVHTSTRTQYIHAQLWKSRTHTASRGWQNSTRLGPPVCDTQCREMCGQWTSHSAWGYNGGALWA